MTNLPSQIFENIEKNSYLNELYDAILFNYSLALLNIDENRRDFSIVHALQFADVLSKSTHPTNSDKHKIWAQEMVSLLNFLEPNNSDVSYTLSSVLSNVGNYRGMEVSAHSFNGSSLFDNAYDKFSRNILSIPAEPDKHFFRSQKIAYDLLTSPAFSYSGPTSLGKSFIMRMFIKKQVLDGAKQNFALIVPTKALINEVSSKMIADLKSNLGKFNYKVVKFADQLTLKKDGNFIFVLTPERLLYLLISEPTLVIDYLFIDEAHKISTKDKRSTFYYNVVDMFTYRQKPHFIFASPNIPNPNIYLKLLPNANSLKNNALTTSFSPVSQIKYLIDLPDNSISYYNPSSKEFPLIYKMSNRTKPTVCNLVSRIGDNKQNLIYVSATEQAANFAMEYAEDFAKPEFTAEQEKLLHALSKDIDAEVHPDCFLAKTILKGVAYHIGYLPASIRMRIEELFCDGVITTLFCTSTLIEGVNLPADNLFVTSYWNGTSYLTQVEFRNLIGRVGRIEYNLYGNVFLLRLPEKPGAKRKRNERKKFEELLRDEVEPQELSLVSSLSDEQKEHIILCLVDGNISLIRDNEEQPSNYDIMRKFAQILLKDIIKNRNSLVRAAFADYVDEFTITKIKEAFKKSADKIDDDINTSVDQVISLRDAITNGLAYPELDEEGKIDYDVLLAFLQRLLGIFKWDLYEKSTLGKPCNSFKINKKCRQHYKCNNCKKQGEPYKKLGWYAVILIQWLRSNGVKQIIDSSMNDKKKKKSRIGYGDNTVQYNYKDPAHRNVVISDTLKAIEQVVLFSLANYFLKFSNEYKRFHKKTTFKNDWYEFVEYGTTNELVIYFQRSGFSRESALYIKNSEYVVDRLSDTPRLKRSIADCANANVKKEVADQMFNAPELFVD